MMKKLIDSCKREVQQLKSQVDKSTDIKFFQQVSKNTVFENF